MARSPPPRRRTGPVADVARLCLPCGSQTGKLLRRLGIRRPQQGCALPWAGRLSLSAAAHTVDRTLAPTAAGARERTMGRIRVDRAALDRLLPDSWSSPGRRSARAATFPTGRRSRRRSPSCRSRQGCTPSRRHGCWDRPRWRRPRAAAVLSGETLPQAWTEEITAPCAGSHLGGCPGYLRGLVPLVCRSLAEVALHDAG